MRAACKRGKEEYEVYGTFHGVAGMFCFSNPAYSIKLREIFYQSKSEHSHVHSESNYPERIVD